MPQDFPYAQESAAVEEAASQALHLIDSYVTKEETNDPHGPWRQPEQIWQSLDAARTKLTLAWRELSLKMSQDEAKHANAATTTITDEDFRVVYVNMITDAFADILEDLRKNDPDFNVDVLVDCLQSGMELINGEDREFWVKEWQGENHEDVDEDGLTPHARRRRDLGYDVDVEASST